MALLRMLEPVNFLDIDRLVPLNRDPALALVAETFAQRCRTRSRLQRRHEKVTGNRRDPMEIVHVIPADNDAILNRILTSIRWFWS